MLGCSAVFAASEPLPTDPRLLFNRGSELVLSGKFAEAEKILRQVAVVKDRVVAAKALTLLGQIAAASARQNVAENAAETTQEQRQNILDNLQSAEKSFAESLTLVPNDEVRQHLENIRAWRHNQVNLWENVDREQHRKTELQQRIQWLADWEKKLIENVQPEAALPNTPRKFQVGYEKSKEQKHLAEELTLLQKEPMNDETLKKQWSRLPEIQKIADESAEFLSQHRLDDALPKQQQVWDFLQTLLKQNQNQQNQNQEQDKSQQQEQNDQKQQNQEPQEQPKPEESKQEQEQKMNQPQSDPQERQGQAGEAEKKEEEAKSKAEQQLLQVRRKEQAADKRREQLRARQMQWEPVEKDW